MSVKIASDTPTTALAKRFMNCFTALRGHIASKSIINYPPGLSPNQIKMMHLIAHRPGISQTVVAERLGVTTASISTSVRELEAQGLIERRANPDDARVMLLHLAPFGEEIFEQMFDSFTHTFADLLKALSDADQAQLVHLLEQALTANDVDLDSSKLNYADKFKVMRDRANPMGC
jgi:DNA-binding MarR family transcriptional regulator